MFRSTQKIFLSIGNKIGPATPPFFEKGFIDSVDVKIPYTASVKLPHMWYVRNDKWQIEYLTTSYSVWVQLAVERGEMCVLQITTSKNNVRLSYILSLLDTNS